MRRANYERESETVAFSGFLNAERQRILAAATPKRRAQMEAAEESRTVYRAWNAVCSGTRESGKGNPVAALGELFTELNQIRIDFFCHFHTARQSCEL